LFEFENLKGTQIENKILTFLKYNKQYTSFLEHYLNVYEPAITKFTTLQKNIVLKFCKETIYTFGYLNEMHWPSLKAKIAYNENEMALLLDLLSDQREERFYQKRNKVIIDDLFKRSKTVKKYHLVSSMKINSKKTKSS
jgi:hypothetical protein